MRKFSVFAILTVLAVAVNVCFCGELAVIHSPDFVNFRSTSDYLPLPKLNSIILAIFGRQTEEGVEWNGLLQGNFFQRPKANVLFSVSGIQLAELNLTKNFYYQTSQDAAPLDVDPIVYGLEGFEQDYQPLLFVDMAVDRQHRLICQTNDYQLSVAMPRLWARRTTRLGKELEAMQRITLALRDNFSKLQRSSPDFFHFRLQGMERIRTKYGPGSPEWIAAVSGLESAVMNTVAEMRALYRGSVVAELLAYNPAAQSRPGRMMYTTGTGRRLLAETTSNSSALNLAPQFSFMYPDMFNISLRFIVVFVLIIFGVNWCIWFTDPGRDGIIYRMTTHHIKEA